MRKQRLLSQSIILALMITTPAWSQSFTASIRGIITDGSGSSIPGAKVIVTDVRQDTAQSTADEIKARGGKASAYQLDVTDAAACIALAKQAAGEVGPVNVLVNNAGIIIRETIDSPRAPENWRRVMDVNVNGIFNVVHAWLPALRQTRGNIINVASIASFVGVGGNLGYSPSKGAVKLFTQALARDLASDGIRVNAIAPGVIETPMTASTREASRKRGRSCQCPDQQCRHHYSRDDR